MRIRLPDFYSGVPSGNRMISPGDYDEDDPRLYGTGSYLVRTGHAVALEDEAEKASEPALEDMTVTQLKDLAKARGMDVGARITKTELLALLAPNEDDDGEDAGDDHTDSV